MLIVQFEPALRVAPHVLFEIEYSAASAPESVIPLIVMVILPVFENVTICDVLGELTI